MIKTIAYEVLGLDSDASIEEIKEAYAILSKQYHPEENPEEFQRIHEAYVTLVRSGKKKPHHTFVPMSLEQPLQKDSFVVDVSNVEHETKEKSYDFDEVEYRVQQEKEVAYYQQLEMTLQRLDKIVLANGDVYKDLLKSIFEEVPLEIIGNKVFIEKLIFVLSNAKIEDSTCEIVRQGVRLWDESLHSGHRELLEELDNLLKIDSAKPKKVSIVATLIGMGILIICLIFCLLIMRPYLLFLAIIYILHAIQASDFWIVFLVGGILAILMEDIYKLCRFKLTKRMSFGISSVCGACILAIANVFGVLETIINVNGTLNYIIIIIYAIGLLYLIFGKRKENNLCLNICKTGGMN